MGMSGKSFMEAAADACEAWAPYAASSMRFITSRWEGDLSMRLAVAAVHGHVAPNWARLPANLRAAAIGLGRINGVVGRDPEESIKCMREIDRTLP